MSLVAHAGAVEIQVQFDQPGQPIPLRLSQASNGWTHSGWSQYYNDIGVQYRRMDHWNDAYGPVRRRPDGGLWYDDASLDGAIRDSTGGFSYKAYPTVDFCPACLDTDFLQNPIQLDKGTVHASITPVGTLFMSGQAPTIDASMGMLVGTVNGTGDYEIDRKGNIIGRYPYHDLLLVTPTNRVAVRTTEGYSLLGPDRKEISHGPGLPLQEIDGKSLLVASGSADGSRKLSLVDLKGAVIKAFDGTYPNPSLVVKAGLVSFGDKELFVVDQNGKRTIQKFPDDMKPPLYMATNPQDPKGRFYAVVSDSKNGGTVYAFSSDGQMIWKSDPLPLQDLRGLIATRDGKVVVSAASTILGVDQTGVHWKTDTRGGLDFQLVSSEGMEGAVARTYEDEIDEYDVRTGEPLWRYGTYGDQSWWMRNPPQDLDGWADQLHHYLKHYDKDLGLGWDRWELWNEPTSRGYFWSGTWQDYAAMLDVSMKVVQSTDPTIIMDAYDGAGTGWWVPLIAYCNDHKVRLDAISWHGYRNSVADYDAQEKQDLDQHFSSFGAYTGGKLQLANTEWNVHPGQGEDLSKRYETGYYRAPFQSEMVYLMGNAGVKFSSEFAMVSGIAWPCGWIYSSPAPIGDQTPKPGASLFVVTPAYSTARLWAMLPDKQAPVTNDFAPQAGISSHVSAIAGSDPAKGEYGILVWNYSNQAPTAKDETINLTCEFKGESQLYMRHFVIDADHSTYTKDWEHQWLEATESGQKPAAALEKQTVVLKKDALHAFFFTRDPLKANAGKSISIEAHHPVQFDGSLSTGMPAFYRWDVDATDGVDYPDPNNGPPSTSHLYGMKPILVHGYDKPGTYTVTLRVSADGYHKVTSTATTTVTVAPEKTAPEAPKNLTANSAKTDHQVFLQWDSLNFARNPDVTGFVVYRKDGTGDWKKLASAPATTSYVDSGVMEKVPYSYRVTAIDSSGNESAPSPEAATIFQINRQAPKTPVTLKAVIFADDTVKLDWNNDSLADGASVTGFNVYRRTAGSSDWEKLTNDPVWDKRYYDDVSNPGMADKYEYCVTALDLFKNESLKSDAAAPVAAATK